MPTEAGLVRLRAQVKKLYRWIGHVEPWTERKVVDSFKDRRWKMYDNALRSLEVRSFDKGDASIKAFIKSELFDPGDKVNPDPRVISARSPRYNILLAKFIRPLEHRMYKMRSKRGLRVFAKGLNSTERAEVIRAKMDCFADTVCFSLDASRWDKHVDFKVLEIEHSVYKRATPDPRLNQLLDYQLVNRCRTFQGVKTKVHGKRMSGDITTAIGNCLLMVAMICAIMDMLGIPYEVFDDGDDCLLFIPGKYRQRVRDALEAQFLEFGQEVKLENEATEMEKIVFCQSRPIQTADGWKMVRNWRKVLAHGTSGTKFWNTLSLVKPMMNAVGSCELALNRGVPINQAYALALRRISGDERLKRLEVTAGLDVRTKAELRVKPEEFEKVVYGSVSTPVTLLARQSFEKAFGVPIWEQHAIENRLAAWNPTLEYIDIPTERDHSWRDYSDVNHQPVTCY